LIHYSDILRSKSIDYDIGGHFKDNVSPLTDCERSVVGDSGRGDRRPADKLLDPSSIHEPNNSAVDDNFDNWESDSDVIDDDSLGASPISVHRRNSQNNNFTFPSGASKVNDTANSDDDEYSVDSFDNNKAEISTR